MVPELTDTEIRKLARYFSNPNLGGIDGTRHPRYYPELGECRTHVYHGDSTTDKACEKLVEITKYAVRRSDSASVTDKNGKTYSIRWETTIVDQLWNIRIYVKK